MCTRTSLEARLRRIWAIFLRFSLLHKCMSTFERTSGSQNATFRQKYRNIAFFESTSKLNPYQRPDLSLASCSKQINVSEVIPHKGCLADGDVFSQPEHSAKGPYNSAKSPAKKPYVFHIGDFCFAWTYDFSYLNLYNDV